MLSLALSLVAAIGACTTDVTVSPASDGLRATFALCAAVDHFQFDANDTPQRSAAWQAPAGWSFDGAVLRRADGATFRSFTLDLASDRRFYDRHYVAIDPVGRGGWAVHLPAFRGASSETRVRFRAFPRGDVVRFAGATTSASSRWLPADNPQSHDLAYVGPARYIAPGPSVLIAGEEVPEWLRTQVLRDVNHAKERLTARFGSPPRQAMTLIITSVSHWPTHEYKGGVVGSDVIVAEMRGIDLSSPDDSIAGQITNLAAHETVHLWNAGVRHGVAQEQQPWLHEGSAEYLASRLWESDDQLREEAAQRLNACYRRRDTHPLDGSQGAVTGGAPYDCGFVIQLAAEAGSLRAGHGDAFALWRAVFDHDGYSPQTFLDEAAARGGADTAAALHTLMSSAADPAWAQLAQQLTALGVNTHSYPRRARPYVHRRPRLLRRLDRSHQTRHHQRVWRRSERRS